MESYFTVLICVEFELSFKTDEINNQTKEFCISVVAVYARTMTREHELSINEIQQVIRSLLQKKD